MSNGRYDITCPSNARFRLPLTWKDSTGAVVPLAEGWSARMQVREKFTSTAAVVTLASTNGTITLGNTAPNIVLLLPDEETRQVTPGRYVYDLLVTPADGEPERLLWGQFTVQPGVTRDA